MTGLVAGDKQEPPQSFVFSFLNKILLKFHMTKGGGGRRGLLDDGVQMIEMRVSEFDDAKKGRGRPSTFSNLREGSAKKRKKRTPLHRKLKLASVLLRSPRRG